VGCGQQGTLKTRIQQGRSSQQPPPFALCESLIS